MMLFGGESDSVAKLWFVSLSLYYSDAVHVENINYYLHPVAQNEKKGRCDWQHIVFNVVGRLALSKEGDVFTTQ